MYHHDPIIFSDPNVFRPERWLVSDEEFNELKKYMMPFSRGSRMCVAMKDVLPPTFLRTEHTNFPQTHMDFIFAHQLHYLNLFHFSLFCLWTARAHQLTLYA